MTFKEILHQDIIKLPKTQEIPENSFREFFDAIFTKFLDMIKSSNNLSEERDFKADIFKNGIRKLVHGIQKSINAYYRDSPFDAYRFLRDGIKDSNIIGYLPPNSTFIKGANFYRMRVHKGNYLLAQKQLFHIPFNIRGKVSTQRYSIPGFPSLYLSNCTYVAWEEMQRPSFNEIQVSRLVNQRPIQCLDLTTSKYTNPKFNESISEGVIGYRWNELYAVMAWPLIAACSVKVKNRKDSFKPEYIIPQLLLQWIRNNKGKNVDGIKFSSSI